jgi:hypothetical protein
MKTTTFTRKQLYDLVWSEPMSRFAPRYGISNVGLAKICRKHNIPCPPRGYWTLMKFGQAPFQVELPNPSDNRQIALRAPEECRISSPILQEVVARKKAEEKKREAKIEVAQSLRGSHTIVSQANQELQGAKTDENQLMILPKSTPLDIRTSKAALRRALLIMDAVLKALELRGYKVASGPVVQILDVRVRFGIIEALETQREQPKDHDLNGDYEFGHSRFDTKRIPAGHLTLHITDGDAYWVSGCRKSWRDAEQRKVEDRLNEVVAGLVSFAARKKEYDAEQERRAEQKRQEQRRREEEAQRRAEKRQLIQAEQKRVDLLMEHAKCWAESQTLRKYIEARRQKPLAVSGEIEPESGLGRWLVWATQQADRLDPLTDSPPSVLDEPIPEEPKPQYWWER